MFGKNIKPEQLADAKMQDAMILEESQRKDNIIKCVMEFTGAKSLDELEEVVTSASRSFDEKDGGDDDRLFEAITEIKNNHSILDAKEMEKNEDFLNAVYAGFEPEKAYMLAKCEQLIEEAYAEGEKRGKIQAANKNDRIGEIGMSVTGGYKAEIDPNNMTMEELKKIKERLKKGEHIRL